MAAGEGKGGATQLADARFVPAPSPVVVGIALIVSAGRGVPVARLLGETGTGAGMSAGAGQADSENGNDEEGGDKQCESAHGTSLASGIRRFGHGSSPERSQRRRARERPKSVEAICRGLIDLQIASCGSNVRMSEAVFRNGQNAP
jgi:hypothetical protein